MLRGYQKGVVKFVILTGRKPAAIPRQDPPSSLPVEFWGTEE